MLDIVEQQANHPSLVSQSLSEDGRKTGTYVTVVETVVETTAAMQNMVMAVMTFVDTVEEAKVS